MNDIIALPPPQDFTSVKTRTGRKTAYIFQIPSVRPPKIFPAEKIAYARPLQDRFMRVLTSVKTQNGRKTAYIFQIPLVRPPKIFPAEKIAYIRPLQDRFIRVLTSVKTRSGRKTGYVFQVPLVRPPDDRIFIQSFIISSRRP